MHHAVGTPGVFPYPVTVPQFIFVQFFHVLHVPISQWIARLAPAHYCIGRVGPSGALVFPVSLKEIQVQWVVVKAKLAFLVQDVFEYLSPGKTLKLADNEWISLGYLRSCNQEKINGGTILVGANKSTVIDGSVNRRKVQCDSENLQLTTDQSDRAGVAVMRKSEGQIEVSMVIHSTSPLLHITTSATTLEVTSLDRPGKPLIFDVEEHRVDLAKHGVTLRGGGLYSAKTDDREVVFRIDKFSRPGSSALLSRLIPL